MLWDFGSDFIEPIFPARPISYFLAAVWRFLYMDVIGIDTPIARRRRLPPRHFGPQNLSPTFAAIGVWRKSCNRSDGR
jgi:hypothetical protein